MIVYQSCSCVAFFLFFSHSVWAPPQLKLGLLRRECDAPMLHRMVDPAKTAGRESHISPENWGNSLHWGSKAMQDGWRQVWWVNVRPVLPVQEKLMKTGQHCRYFCICPNSSLIPLYGHHKMKEPFKTRDSPQVEHTKMSPARNSRSCSVYHGFTAFSLFLLKCWKLKFNQNGVSLGATFERFIAPSTEYKLKNPVPAPQIQMEALYCQQVWARVINHEWRKER